MCSFPPVRTPKLQLTAEQPLTGECWIPPKKDTPHPKQRRSPNKTIGGGELFDLESNPTQARDAQRPQTKACAHQDPGKPQETEPDKPLSVWAAPADARVSSGLLWGLWLWLQQTWELCHVSPTIEPPSRQPINLGTIKPKFSHCCKSSRAQNRFPNLGIW